MLAGSGDNDGAASRAYYAAFHALSAFLAAEGRTFTKHSELEATLHRDLIRLGRLEAPVGKAFSTLREYRARGDYGGLQHVTAAAAAVAIECAVTVVQGVRSANAAFDGPST